MSDILVKLRIFLLIICIIPVLSGQDYWLRQSSPTSKDLKKCMFVDSLYGWVSGDSGVILNTTNAGVNWNIQQSGIFDYKIEEVFFLNRRLGWAISNDYLFIGTIILTTTNGGVNWINSRFPDSSLIFNTIYFVDSLKGFISGQSGKIYRTSNSGLNWIECGIDSVSCPYLTPKHDLFFINAQTGYSCGGAMDFIGLVWKTTNGGINWASYCLTPEPLNVIKLIRTNEIGAMGGDFDFGANVVYSIDNGFNWTYELTQCFGAATGFSLRTPAEAWAVLSFSNFMVVNLDSMKPETLWLCIPTPENTQLYDIEFTTPTLGWTFGNNGAIFKYNQNVIGINGSINNIPSGYYLFQNYPNPFNNETIISYGIPEVSYVEIIIYDLLGKEIINFNEGLRSAGKYSLNLNADNFSSGVYYYKLVANDYSVTKKMVMIK